MNLFSIYDLSMIKYIFVLVMSDENKNSSNIFNDNKEKEIDTTNVITGESYYEVSTNDESSTKWHRLLIY